MATKFGKDLIASLAEAVDHAEGRAAGARETRLKALDAAIMRGVADADAGRVAELDEVLAELERRYADWNEAGDS